MFEHCPVKVNDFVVCRVFKEGDFGYAGKCTYDAPFIGQVVHKDNTLKCYDTFRLGQHCGVPFFAIERIDANSISPSQRTLCETFLAYHNASGFAIGDNVKILRAAKSYKFGWDNTWTKGTNNCVGKIGKIVANYNECGWGISFGGSSIANFAFPDFVLEKVDEKADIPTPAVVKEPVRELTKEEVGKLYYKMFRKGKRVSKPRSKVHNPHNFTPEQYGKADGYRLLDKDEIFVRDNKDDLIEVFWASTHLWGVGCNCGALTMTYRTKLSRKELAKVK